MIRNSHLVLREASLPPATEWAQSVPGWIFLRIREGDGFLLRSNVAQMVGPGDMLVTGHGTACPLRASQIGPLRFEYFLVHPELLTGLLTPFERQHLKGGSERPQQSFRFFPSDHSYARQFTGLSKQGGDADDLLVRCQMMHLAAGILRDELPKSPANVGNGLTAQERFGRLMQDIPEADLAHLSPSDLAQMCRCSVRHVSRQIKSYFGHSLAPKKTELRLQKARELLEGTDAKIIDVAMESGFQHVGLFTAVFKKHFRVTPSKWRTRHQMKSNR